MRRSIIVGVTLFLLFGLALHAEAQLKKAPKFRKYSTFVRYNGVRTNMKLRVGDPRNPAVPPSETIQLRSGDAFLVFNKIQSQNLIWLETMDGQRRTGPLNMEKILQDFQEFRTDDDPQMSEARRRILAGGTPTEERAPVAREEARPEPKPPVAREEAGPKQQSTAKATTSDAGIYVAKISERDLTGLYDKHNSLSIPLGKYAVLDSMAESAGGKQTDLKNGYITSSLSQTLEGWATITGVVSIKTADKAFEAGDKNYWNNAAKFFGGGVAKSIVITPTEKGLRIGEKTYDEEGIQVLLLRERNKYTVTKVHKIEDRKQGADEYKIVYISCNVQWSPLYAEVSRKVNGVIRANKRKAMLLFKNDPFKGAWKYVAGDEADSDKDFTTRNVANALGM